MQPRRKDRPQDINSFLALLNVRLEEGLPEDDEDKTGIVPKKENGAPVRKSSSNSNSANSTFQKSWLWALLAGLGIIVSLSLFFKRPSKPSDFSLGTSISTTSNPDSIGQTSNEVPVSVESSKVEFKQKRRELNTRIGHKFKLSYSTNSTNPISWMSSNKSVLTVDNNGTITVRGAGTATITASVENEHDACICVIHLLPEEEEEEDFTTPPASAAKAPTGFGAFMYLSRDKITLKVGESFFLTAHDYGSSLSWESNNPKIATVSSIGSVTAHEPGKAFIWAHGSSKSIACVVTVIENNNPSSSVSSSQSENANRSTYSKDVHIKPGESIQIKISDVLVDKWVSDNTRIATVNSKGVITGISSGETNVWYYAEGHPHRCSVHVD